MWIFACIFFLFSNTGHKCIGLKGICPAFCIRVKSFKKIFTANILPLLMWFIDKLNIKKILNHFKERRLTCSYISFNNQTMLLSGMIHRYPFTIEIFLSLVLYP